MKSWVDEKRSPIIVRWRLCMALLVWFSWLASPTRTRFQTDLFASSKESRGEPFSRPSTMTSCASSEFQDGVRGDGRTAMSPSAATGGGRGRRRGDWEHVRAEALCRKLGDSVAMSGSAISLSDSQPAAGSAHQYLRVILSYLPDSGAGDGEELWWPRALSQLSFRPFAVYPAFPCSVSQGPSPMSPQHEGWKATC